MKRNWLLKKNHLILKTFGSFKKIFEDKPKTPLPGVNVANAV